MHRLLIKRTLLKTSTFRCETTKKQPRTKPCLYDETFLFAVFHGESAVPKYVGTSKSGERAPERENPAYRIGHTLWGPLLPSAVRARDLYRVETSGLVQSLLLSSVPPARSTTWHVCTRHAAMYACTHACTWRRETRSQREREREREEQGAPTTRHNEKRPPNQSDFASFIQRFSLSAHSTHGTHAPAVQSAVNVSARFELCRVARGNAGDFRKKSTTYCGETVLCCVCSLANEKEMMYQRTLSRGFDLEPSAIGDKRVAATFRWRQVRVSVQATRTTLILLVNSRKYLKPERGERGGVEWSKNQRGDIRRWRCVRERLR